MIVLVLVFFPFKNYPHWSLTIYLGLMLSALRHCVRRLINTCSYFNQSCSDNSSSRVFLQESFSPCDCLSLTFYRIVFMYFVHIKFGYCSLTIITSDFLRSSDDRSLFFYSQNFPYGFLNLHVLTECPACMRIFTASSVCDVIGVHHVATMSCPLVFNINLR